MEIKTEQHSRSNDYQQSRLDKSSVERYSRQLLLPEIGVKSQMKLMNSSVLVVGAGGLGCPVALYLAAAGVGKLGIVDYDAIELSNLHRQVLHTESRVGQSKAESAAEACASLNSSIECIPHCLSLDRHNAKDIINKYDVVVDCTDNVPTRYLLNDACVMLSRPLVSGSALRFEGQLTVYHHVGGPCYRCLYPTPPPPATISNCGDVGVIGAVTGVIGSLQAMEVIKIICGITSTLSQRLLLYDALETTFRTIKLRPRNKECTMCGDSPTVRELADYEQFCGSQAHDKDKTVHLLEPCDRISVQELSELMSTSQPPPVLLDTRPAVELDICQLPNTIHMPLTWVESEQCADRLQRVVHEAVERAGTAKSVYVICRRGNDSQIATVALRQKFASLGVEFKDVLGGLTAWSHNIDHNFPLY